MSILSFYGIAILVGEMAIRKRALKHALSLVNGKGIVNLGAGCNRSEFAMKVCELPQVVYNIDNAIESDWPNSIALDLEQPLPFADKQFDVAFASHVLEHLENWELALDEWTRIADNVVIALPNPLSITSWILPTHKQHFMFNDIEYIEQEWGVTIFT